MAKNIIVFSGKQFSGKDTVAKMLLELMPQFVRVGLGDAIKIEYGKQKGLSLEQIESNKSQYRPDLIALGNWGRDQDPDYWLKKVLEQQGDIAVPDIRVAHELEIFKSKGAISIRVEAMAEQRAKRGILVKEDDPTETSLDGVVDWDFVIENNEGVEELTLKVNELYSKLKEKLGVK